MEIGTKIYLIQKQKKMGELVNVQWRCRLIDREDESTLLVDYPINEKTEKQSLLIDGSKYVVAYLGKDGALYQFETEIIGRKRENVPMLRLKDPGMGAYRRIQRRDYVRVEATIDIDIHPVNEQEKSFKAISTDVSGGGCQIVLPPNVEMPEQGKEYELTFYLPMQSGDTVIRTKGLVVRSINLTMDKKRASFKFIEMSEGERQKMIKYCFERQLALKRVRQ